MTQHRIGVDLGGTKIEIAVLGPDGTEVLRRRVPTPAGYIAGIAAISGLVRDAEATLGVTATVGVGIPGVISPATGLVKNANSVVLNGHPFDADLSRALDREVRVENDANCFALSEAVDGAGAGYGFVFGVILGTGCGGGLGGFLLASSLGFSKGLTGSYLAGLLGFSALCLLALAGLALVKVRWRTTWGALAEARI